MRQSITTKYIGPTDHRGAKIKATSSSGLKAIFSYADELSIDDNHKMATVGLCRKLGWHGKLAVGGAPKGTGNVFVFVDADTFDVRPDKCSECKAPWHTGLCSIRPKWAR